MAGHRHPVVHAILLTLVSALAAAQDDQKTFDCQLNIGEVKYDLTRLSGEHSVSREIKLPPSTVEDKVTFNLCEDLKHKSEVADEDQCPSGTRACLVRTTKKEDQDGRVFSVIPLANSTANAVKYEQLNSPKGLQLTFAGASYPSAVDTTPVPQHFNLKLLCDPDTTSEVKFTSYDGKDLWLEWSAPQGCFFKSPPDGDTKTPDTGGDDTSGDEKESESVGSGLGYFFLLMFLALVAYFGLGAYYNYSTYGATGADLIPHRDFWREVPYMIRDLVAHICSAVRPRQSASQRGYIAV